MAASAVGAALVLTLVIFSSSQFHSAAAGILSNFECNTCSPGDDPRTCGDGGCGWDTGNKFYMGLLGITALLCSTFDVASSWKPQDCAAKCINQLLFKGYIEFRDDVQNGVKRCVCCQKPCVKTFYLEDQTQQNGSNWKHCSYCPSSPTGGGPPPPPAGGSHDPHFVGGHGTRYDFNGEPGKTYCLITDKDVLVNALFKGYKLDGSDGVRTPTELDHGVRTWMGALGFIWRDALQVRHTLQLVAQHGSHRTATPGLLASIVLDGAEINVPKTPGVALYRAGLRLQLLGTKKLTSDARELWTLSLDGKFTMDIDVDSAIPELRLLDDPMVHFSFRLKNVKTSSQVHGVLGQTFRNTPAQVLKTLKYRALGSLLWEPVRADGPTGLGFLEGEVSDYESSSTSEADCKVSVY